MILNVYDSNCEVRIDMVLPDLEFVSGRTSYDPKSKLFYKGAGTQYKGHFSLTPKYAVLEKTDVLYTGYRVLNEKWKDKYGIFLERYQPAFTDPIGGCGKKEENIINNSIGFLKASPEIKEVIDITDSFKIYVINYIGGKEKFMSSPDIHILHDLLSAMLSTDWNVPWDKNILEDINTMGLVTDVADMFKSRSIIDKFGTTYAFVYGLYKANQRLCESFCNVMGYSASIFNIPFIVYAILDKYNYNLSGITEDWMYFDKKTYNHIITNVLFKGRTCASLGGKKYHELAIEGYEKLLCR